MYSPVFQSGPTKVVGQAFTVKFVPNTDESAPKLKGNYVRTAIGYAQDAMLTHIERWTRSQKIPWSLSHSLRLIYMRSLAASCLCALKYEVPLALLSTAGCETCKSTVTSKLPYVFLPIQFEVILMHFRSSQGVSGRQLLGKYAILLRLTSL